MTRIFYTLDAPEIELEFVRWTTRSLVVKRPPGMKRAGQDWRIGRRQVIRFLKAGILRIEGERPDWARVIQ